MGSQSDELAEETAAMRLFDRALQAAAGLPHRTHMRVLRYVHERVGDRLDTPATTGGATSFGTVTAPGGGSPAGGSTAGSAGHS